MTHHGPIVVGVDGSPAAQQALRWTAKAARLHGLPVRLVHAYDILPDYQTILTDRPTLLATMHERGRQWLQDAHNLLAELAPTVGVEVELRAAPVVPCLIEESAKAAMMVIGTHGHGHLTGLLGGSTAVALASHAHSPVVIARTRHDDEQLPTAGPVVVGVDGSPISEDAIAFAFAEASTRSCALTAVHAWTDSLLEAALADNPQALDFEPLQQQAHELLAQRLAGWQEKYPDVQVHREGVRDRPTQALLRYAQTAQLLVVGSSGHGGFTGMLLGSTSQNLMRHAPCPVVIVRPDTAR